MIRATAVGAAGLTLALLTAACALAWEPDSPLVPRNGGHVSGTAPLFLLLLATAFAAYLVALACTRQLAPSTRIVIALAAAIQLVPLCAPLLLSTDAWTYWSYGWIGSRGNGNPYVDKPESFPANPALPYQGTDWLDTTTVYGPVFTAASQPVALVAGDSSSVAAWSFKALAGAAALAAALLAGRIATRRKAFAVALVGWNPLLAVHLAGGGHNDGWVGALILVALALSVSGRIERSGAIWMLAIGIKWVPALFLLLRALGEHANGRPIGRRGLALGAAGVAGVATILYALAWPLAILPLIGNATSETGAAIPRRLEDFGVPNGVAIGLAVITLAAGLIWLIREAGRGRPRLALAACLILVTTPYLAVWYLAWTVPLAAAEEDSVATVACLALCAYLLSQTIPI